MGFQQQTEMRYNSLKYLGVLLVALLIACDSDKKSDTDPQTNFDESAMLINMADNVILYHYTELQSKLQTLKSDVNALVVDLSNSNIETAKSSYLATNKAWQNAAVYQFGPASDIGLAASFNTYPIDEALIESNIDAGTWNISNAAGYVATGLNTIDYLLYGATELTSARVSYLADVIDQMNTNLDYVINTWNNEYRTSFISNTGTQNGSSISNMINGAMQYFEGRLRNGKIRIPSGILNGNIVDLTRVETPYSDEYSFELFLEAMEGINNFYTGTGKAGDGLGIDDYLEALNVDYENTKLHLQIAQDIAEVKTLATQLSSQGSISEVISSDRPSIVSLHNAVQDVIGLWKVDMTIALGVSITYQDTDGD